MTSINQSAYWNNADCRHLEEESLRSLFEVLERVFSLSWVVRHKQGNRQTQHVCGRIVEKGGGLGRACKRRLGVQSQDNA